MGRSLKKGPFLDEKLAIKIAKHDRQSKTVIKTWSRSSVIFPDMIGITFGVHNGKVHTPVLVTEDMVGHRLGEFSPTRTFKRHGGKIQKEAEKGGK